MEYFKIFLIILLVTIAICALCAWLGHKIGEAFDPGDD